MERLNVNISSQDYILLLCIASLAVALGLVCWRLGSSKPNLDVLQALVSQLHEGVRAQHDVSQLFAIIDKLKEREGDLTELGGWMHEMLVAAFMVRINGQVADIRAMRGELSLAREEWARGDSFGYRLDTLVRAEQWLGTELDALVDAAARYGIRLPEVA